MKSPFRCWIYSSPRKDEMYLYLSEENNFAAVPAELLDRFGAPRFVMELELHPGKRLAREDAEQVLKNLRTSGFHLQMPPRLVPHLYHGNDL